MNELTKQLVCVQMRSGVEIWMESERAEGLQNVLHNITQSKFIQFGDQTFNSADIVGVFRADTMEAATRRKNGQTQCKEGKWHDKNERCDCLDGKSKKRIDEMNAAMEACNLGCTRGFQTLPNGSAAMCSCLAPFV